MRLEALDGLTCTNISPKVEFDPEHQTKADDRLWSIARETAGLHPAAKPWDAEGKGALTGGMSHSIFRTRQEGQWAIYSSSRSKGLRTMAFDLAQRLTTMAFGTTATAFIFDPERESDCGGSRTGGRQGEPSDFGDPGCKCSE
jgi:hypothetical protein